MHVLAITTYNRIDRLKNLLNSFFLTRDDSVQWQIIIADDYSTDGTREYLDKLKTNHPEVISISNQRKGIHHQFNSIIQLLENLDFNVCFMCDDDIQFLKSGWEMTYIHAIKVSGYAHLCHFDPKWRMEKNLKTPVVEGPLIGHCHLKDVQGAFFTITPDIVRQVGYMDTENFGFRGVGHIDYTARACRAGFNHLQHPFDVKESGSYIRHQHNNYRSALNIHVQNALESPEENTRKYALVEDSSRIYIPYFPDPPSFTSEMERELLFQRLERLEEEKRWYENTYGHQPRWLVRLGKLLRYLKIT